MDSSVTVIGQMQRQTWN